MVDVGIVRAETVMHVMASRVGCIEFIGIVVTLLKYWASVGLSAALLGIS